MGKKGSPTMPKVAKEELRQQDEPVVEKTEAASPCRHYWLLEFPSGPTSRAVCKLCGATREFPNAASDYIYEEEMASTFGPSRYRPDDD